MTRHCPSAECPFVAKHGFASEYAGEVEACVDCGAALIEGPAPRQVREGRAIPGKVWTRLAITLGGIALAWLLTVVPELLGAELDFHLASATSLGILPFLSAAFLVEVAALVVPRWRHLRLSGLEGRRRLTIAALILSVPLVVWQSWGIYLFAMGLPAGPDGFVEPSWPLLILSTLAGTTLLLGLAWALGRWGISGGVAALVVGGHALGLDYLVRAIATAELDVPGYAKLLATALGIIGLTLWALTRRTRVKLLPGTPALSLRLPLSGLEPLGWAALVLTIAAMIEAGFVHFYTPEVLIWASEGPDAHRPQLLTLAALVLFTVLWAWLFNRPAALREMVARAAGVDPALPGVRRQLSSAWIGALLRSLLIVLGWVGLAWLGNDVGPFPSLVLLITGTALALDIRAEILARAASPEPLVAAWSLSRVPAVDLTVEALAAEDIHAHPRGSHLRSLFYFFAPYLPVEVLVPASEVDRARALCEALHATGPRLPDAGETRNVVGDPRPTPRSATSSE